LLPADQELCQNAAVVTEYNIFPMKKIIPTYIM